MEALKSQATASDNPTGLITNNIDIWTSAIKTRSSAGRGSNKKRELYGIKKLRELILELAVRGKLVAQDPNDEPASVLLERIAAEKAQLIKDKKVKKQKALPSIGQDEKPFDVPQGWEWCRLQNMTSKVTDGDHKTPPRIQEGYRLLSAKNVRDGYLDMDNSDFISKEDYLKSRDRCCAEKGDLLIVSVGGTIGRSSLVPADDKFALVRSVALIKPMLLRSSYLKYAMDSKLLQDSIHGNKRGGAQPCLYLSEISKFPFAMPPLAEQHRIVAKVDELMALCDQLEQQTEASIDAHATLVETLLTTLTSSTDAAELEQNWHRLADHFDTLFTTEHSIDQLKQTILQLAVMGKLVPQDPNDEPAAVLLEKIAAEKAQLVKEKKIKKQKPLPPITEDEKPFALPEGWEWCRLQSVVSLLGDGLHGTPEYKPDEKYYFVNGNNLKQGHIVIKPETKTVARDQYDKYRKNLGDNTVLVSINGTLGNVAFYNNEKIVLGKSACYFNLMEGIYKPFTKLVIESPGFISYAFKNATGSTIKNLGLKAMNSLPVALPSKEEQHRIVAKVDQLMALCDQLKARLQQAQQTQLHLADALVEKAVR